MRAVAPIRSGERPIAPGNGYDALFPRPDRRDRTLVRDGEVGDTLELMRRVVWTYRDDTRGLAPLLRHPGLEETCRAIWAFIYGHIQYRLDKKGLEQLRRPARTWQERRQGVDCDCMSIFASSVLLNLGIPHAFRVTRYASPHWQHVYVIVPRPGGGHHVIDGVLSRFDHEKPYADKMDYDMDMKGIDVAVLSGPDDLDGGAFAYRNLLDTRRALLEGPALAAVLGDPEGLARMLDYAIRYFNTERRGAALALLARHEDLLNAQSGVYEPQGYGLDTDDEVLGAVGARHYFRCVQAACQPCRPRERPRRQAIPHAVLPVAVIPCTPCTHATPAVRTAWTATLPHTATAAPAAIPSPELPTQTTMAQTTPPRKGAKKAAQGAVQAVIKFNPVSIAARNGYLLALKLNLGDMAGRLKWGYADQSQASAAGIAASTWQKARSALARVEELFADRLQGSRQALRNAILKGKAGGLGHTGLGEGATAAAIAAAAPLILATLKILKEAGLIGPNVNLDVSELEAEAQKALQEQAIAPQAAVPNPSAAMEPNNSGGGTIAWAKANPLPALALAAGIGYLAYNALAGPAQKRAKGKSLSGLPKGRRSGAKRKKAVRAVLLR